MKKNKMVILNGPSQAGKDEIAAFFADYVFSTYEESRAMICALATPAKEQAITAMIMNGAKDENDILPWFETEAKNKPCPFLNDMSVRAYVIEYAENHMKAMFGPDIFGKSARTDIITSDYPEYVIVTDSGFFPELDQLVLLKDKYEIYFVSVTRPHKTWNESRTDLKEYASSLGMDTSIVIENDADLGKLKQQVENMMEVIG
jgi:hypothetical protein